MKIVEVRLVAWILFCGVLPLLTGCLTQKALTAAKQPTEPGTGE